MTDTFGRFGLSRRSLVVGLAAAPALTAGTTPAAAQAQGPETAAQQLRAALKNGKGTKLVLLGTGGGPVPGRARHMTLHVMLSDGAAYVLDCGLGVTGQFARTGIPLSALRSIFITHHVNRACRLGVMTDKTHSEHKEFSGFDRQAPDHRTVQS